MSSPKIGTKAQISALYRGVASIKIKDIQGDVSRLLAYQEVCEYLKDMPAQFLPVSASNTLPRKLADINRIINYAKAVTIFNGQLANVEPASGSEDEDEGESEGEEEEIELSEPESPPPKKRRASRKRKVSESPAPKAKKSKAKGKKPALRSKK